MDHIKWANIFKCSTIILLDFKNKCKLPLCTECPAKPNHAKIMHSVML